MLTLGFDIIPADIFQEDLEPQVTVVQAKLTATNPQMPQIRDRLLAQKK
jgi:hypothetical protein